MKYGRENWQKKKDLLMGNVRVLARTSMAVKKHLSFCRELSMLCVED